MLTSPQLAPLPALNDAVVDPAVAANLEKDKARATALLASLKLPSSSSQVSNVTRGRTIYI